MISTLVTIAIILVLVGYFEPKIDENKESKYLWYNWKGKRRYKKL